MIHILYPIMHSYIHSIVNPSVLWAVTYARDLVSSWPKKRPYNYPGSTSSSLSFEVQGTWTSDVSLWKPSTNSTLNSVSPASGASSVMPDMRDHVFEQNPGRHFPRLNSGAPDAHVGIENQAERLKDAESYWDSFGLGCKSCNW